MADYKLTRGGVIRLDDLAHIPDTSANRDWREYQDWLAEGNTPEPTDPPPPPPTKGELYDQAIKGVVGAIIEAIDDGSFLPGGNVGATALKATITAKM